MRKLFDINPTIGYPYKDSQIIDDNGKTPFVTTTSYNNGIVGYSNLKATHQGNVITASDTTTTDAIFYQEKPFIGRSHVQEIKPKFPGFNRGVALYVITAFKKAAGNTYNYGVKFNRDNMYNTKITLPIDKEGNPDFDMMEKIMHTHTLKSLLKINKYLMKES